MALSINEVIIGGNIVRDLELKKVGAKEAPLVNFSVAINSKYKDTMETAFINCVAWYKDAEILAENFKKGNEIVVIGRLQNEKWQDKDGNERTRDKVVVSRFGRGLSDILFGGGEVEPAKEKKVRVKKEKSVETEPEVEPVATVNELPF